MKVKLPKDFKANKRQIKILEDLDRYLQSILDEKNKNKAKQK